MPDFGKQLNALQRRIEDGERGADSGDILLEFSNTLALLKSEYSDARHVKLLRHLTRIAEHVGGLEDALTDRSEAENIVRWINRNYDNEETNRDYRVALRVFGKRMEPNGSGEPPESIAWVPASTSSDYDPTPNPADMLDWDTDVTSMIDAAKNSRDKALFALQFDAGLRGEELFNLTIGQITDSRYGLRVFVDGKTGQRSVDLIPSVQYVTRWLGDHPGRNDSEAKLWSKLDEPSQLSYQRYLTCFRESARRAGVTKPVTPTNFRKSNATWLAKQGANAALIEDRQGRSRGSKAVARYVARFGDDMEAQYAAMNGHEIGEQDESEPPTVTCPRCNAAVPRREPRCLRCNFALSADAIESDRTVDDRTIRSVVDDPELVDAIMTIRDRQRDDPELSSLLNPD